MRPMITTCAVPFDDAAWEQIKQSLAQFEAARTLMMLHQGRACDLPPPPPPPTGISTELKMTRTTELVDRTTGRRTTRNSRNAAHYYQYNAVGRA